MVTLLGSWPSLAEEYNDSVKTLERDNACKLINIKAMIIIFSVTRDFLSRCCKTDHRHKIHSKPLASCMATPFVSVTSLTRPGHLVNKAALFWPELKVAQNSFLFFRKL